jgi:GNAT superfamily N-acetyltransferase
LLSEAISSIDRATISRYVFSPAARSRKIHTWAIVPREAKPSVKSVAVFREHQHVSIIELIFVATASEYRGEGYGSFLINSLISKWTETESVTYVLTYADISAIRFFKSIGFTHEVPFPRDLIDPWIDKYSGSLLMVYQIIRVKKQPSISSLPKMVKVLVFKDNTDRFAEELWCTAVVLSSKDCIICVQYAYMHRIYTEYLPIFSPRLREMDKMPTLDS